MVDLEKIRKILLSIILIISLISVIFIFLKILYVDFLKIWSIREMLSQAFAILIIIINLAIIFFAATVDTILKKKIDKSKNKS
ncbi:MAG: hypothetical protein ACFFCC_01015 [Promethearchaeota archaeon]